MHEDVEAVGPVLAQFAEAVRNLLVAGDIQRDDDVAAVLFSGLFDARLEFVGLVGESQLRTFAVHGFGDAACDRTLAGDAGDQCALALQETHDSSSWLAAWGG
jgi:hypothetical protein